VRRNVTLALDEEILLRAKVLAARERTSVSALMRAALEQRLREEDDSYTAARRRFEALVGEGGLDLGTHGRATWTRDELHER
jgi:predicted transcriptional regulator